MAETTNTLTYVKGNNLDELINSIDENFKTIADRDLFKGDKGDNVSLETVELKKDGVLTGIGKAVYKVIFDTDTTTAERVKGFPDSWQLYPAMPLFFVYHEGDTTDFKDYSCMVVTDDTGNYTKYQVFPTIYYDSKSAEYCWMINGVPTSLPTYKEPEDSNNVQLFLMRNFGGDMQYWNPNTGTWTADIPKSVVAGDLAYNLSSSRVPVAGGSTEIPTIDLYSWNGAAWKKVTYSDSIDSIITYDDARMTYIWKTIYDSLGQDYSTTLIDAKCFKFPDASNTDYSHRITSMSNSNRSDLRVEYTGDKEHNIVLDGYNIYTEAPEISSDGVVFNDAKKLIDNESAYKVFKLSDLTKDGVIDQSVISNYTFVCVDRGERSGDFIRYVYINKPSQTQSPGVFLNAFGINQDEDEMFEVHYDLVENVIKWMKDKWGNECDYDMVKEPVFHGIDYMGTEFDLRKRGYVRNNIIKNTDLYITVDERGGGEIFTSTIEIYDNVFRDCNPDGNCIIKLNSFTNNQTVICSHNTFINSTININCGYYYRYDMPNDNTDSWSNFYSTDCRLSDNFISNSTVLLSLGVHRFCNNEIKNSNIPGIYAVFPSVGSDSNISSTMCYSIDGDSAVLGALWHNKDYKYSPSDSIATIYAQTWLFPLLAIEGCKFSDFVLNSYMGYFYQSPAGAAASPTDSSEVYCYRQCLSNQMFFGRENDRTDNPYYSGIRYGTRAASTDGTMKFFRNFSSTDDRIYSNYYIIGSVDLQASQQDAYTEDSGVFRLYDAIPVMFFGVSRFTNAGETRVDNQFTSPSCSYTYSDRFHQFNTSYNYEYLPKLSTCNSDTKPETGNFWVYKDRVYMTTPGRWQWNNYLFTTHVASLDRSKYLDDILK